MMVRWVISGAGSCWVSEQTSNELESTAEDGYKTLVMSNIFKITKSQT
jgi:hypothetical protein